MIFKKVSSKWKICIESKNTLENEEKCGVKGNWRELERTSQYVVKCSRKNEENFTEVMKIQKLTLKEITKENCRELKGVHKNVMKCSEN